MRIEVNGEPRAVEVGQTIADMLVDLVLDPTRVAVERNRAIVPRSTFAEVALGEGDRIEIVHFVGGG